MNTVNMEHRALDTFILLWNPDGWAWTLETRARSQQDIRDTGVLLESGHSEVAGVEFEKRSDFSS